jgi:hypothetical protein
MASDILPYRLHGYDAQSDKAHHVLPGLNGNTTSDRISYSRPLIPSDRVVLDMKFDQMSLGSPRHVENLSELPRNAATDPHHIASSVGDVLRLQDEADDFEGEFWDSIAVLEDPVDLEKFEPPPKRCCCTCSGDDQSCGRDGALQHMELADEWILSTVKSRIVRFDQDFDLSQSISSS